MNVFVIAVDAVYAMAHAVHEMIRDVCGPGARKLCAKLKPAPQGKDLLKYIRNVSFIGKLLLHLKLIKKCFRSFWLNHLWKLLEFMISSILE